MILTLGFTESDPDRDYNSFIDSYRIGVPQRSVTITLEGHGRGLSALQWADAAFDASNRPGPASDHTAAAIQHALATQVHTPLRSLSAGDTVTAHGQLWACGRLCWPFDGLMRFLLVVAVLVVLRGCLR